MLCPNCGQPCESGQAFCSACGSELHFDQPQGSGFRSTIKKLVCSPLYLVAVISYCIAQLAGLVSGFFQSNDIYAKYIEIFDEWFPELDIAEEFAAQGETVGATQVVTFIPSSLFSYGLVILICVSMWLVYAAVKKEQFSLLGLNILRVVSIIEVALVTLCFKMLSFLTPLLGIAFGGMTVAAAVEGAEYEIIAGIFAVICVLTILMLPLFAALVVYQVMIVKTINVVRKAIKLDRPVRGVSMFLVVMCFILGVWNVLLGFLMIPFMNPASLIAQIGCAVSQIGFGILLLKYRKETEQQLLQIG